MLRRNRNRADKYDARKSHSEKSERYLIPPTWSEKTRIFRKRLADIF